MPITTQTFIFSNFSFYIQIFWTNLVPSSDVLKTDCIWQRALLYADYI